MHICVQTLELKMGNMAYVTNESINTVHMFTQFSYFAVTATSNGVKSDDGSVKCADFTTTREASVVAESSLVCDQHKFPLEKVSMLFSFGLRFFIKNICYIDDYKRKINFAR